ncbi:hypothetical protein [Bradyrhizobium guangzhouense]|nr:hypothetical protein [Bradyrhizobium guangzhouense]
MTSQRELLIRGSEKVIGHYELLLANAKTSKSASSIASGLSASYD